MSRLFISTINVESGKIVASDPCYRLGTWCMDTFNVRNGKYYVYLTRKTEDGFEKWGERNWEMLIVHEDFVHFKVEDLCWEMTGGNFGVDSGTFGFFDYDYYAKYHNEDDMDTFDKWYDRKVCNVDGFWHNCDGKGVWCTSGYGDGSYDVYGVYENDEGGDIVALEVVFIYEDEEDE